MSAQMVPLTVYANISCVANKEGEYWKIDDISLCETSAQKYKTSRDKNLFSENQVGKLFCFYNSSKLADQKDEVALFVDSTENVPRDVEHVYCFFLCIHFEDSGAVGFRQRPNLSQIWQWKP